MNLDIIIPVHNDENTITDLYNKINEFLDKIDDDTNSIEDLLIEGTELLEEYRPLSGLVLND